MFNEDQQTRRLIVDHWLQKRLKTTNPNDRWPESYEITPDNINDWISSNHLTPTFQERFDIDPRTRWIFRRLAHIDAIIDIFITNLAQGEVPYELRKICIPILLQVISEFVREL